MDICAVQFELGRYDRAEEYYREALEMNLAWHGELHPVTAANLTMLGRALVFLGEDAEGVEHLAHALEIRERVYGSVHPSVASVLNELGNSALSHERYDDAEEYFSRMAGI